MSKFNLLKYINESLTSGILQNQILNEPSGFFKYVKTSLSRKIQEVGPDKNKYERDVFKSCNNLLKQINNVLFHLFFLKKYDVNYDLAKIDKYGVLSKNNGDIFFTTNYLKLSDNELININKKYNKDIIDFQRKIKNLFNRPNGRLLMYLLKNGSSSSESLDLLSITDNQLKKYTF